MDRCCENNRDKEFTSWCLWYAKLKLVAVLGIVLSSQLLAASAESPPQFNKAVLVRLEGEITPLMESFFDRQLESATARGADLLIIEIDSPGGFVDSSFNIARRLRDVDWARTVAFIPRQALSGAAIMALGCDEIVIASDAVLGDAGPIFQGEDALFRYAPEKIRTDIAQQIRNLAQAKGRSPALAEAMVNMDLVVYRSQHRQTNEERFLTAPEIESAGGEAVWKKLDPVFESRKDHFLEVNGQRAVELKLANGNAESRSGLSKYYGLAKPPTVLEYTGVDTAVFILNLPMVTGLLLVVGLIALYVEFSAPGIGAGGLISVLCFVLFFWSRFLGGTAGVLEVILFLMGLLFIAMEIFVIPGFGVAGITGLLLTVVSVIMASQHFVIPNTGRQLSTFSNSLLIVSLSGVAFLVAAMMISRHFGSLPLVSRLALVPPKERTEPAPAKTDKDGKPLPTAQTKDPLGIEVGDWGTALTPLRPSGKVTFGHHDLDVLANSGYVDAGRQVRIVEINGNRITVTEIPDA